MKKSRRKKDEGQEVAEGGEHPLNLRAKVSFRSKNEIDAPVPKWHLLGMHQTTAEARTRITARVSDKVRNTLEQAAELSGASVNQFVVHTAYLEAQRVIERESVIRLSQKDARKVLSLIAHPPKPNSRLKAAAKAYQASVRG